MLAGDKDVDRTTCPLDEVSRVEWDLVATQVADSLSFDRENVWMRRSPAACKLRWLTCLSPKLNASTGFSDEEKRLLVESDSFVEVARAIWKATLRFRPPAACAAVYTSVKLPEAVALFLVPRKALAPTIRDGETLRDFSIDSILLSTSPSFGVAEGPQKGDVQMD